MKFKLITEGNIAKPAKIITEAKGSSTNLYVEGIYIECDIVNKNGRLYQLEHMKPVIEKYIREKVETNRAWGELNHPQDLEINPDRISHRIVELRQEGSNFIGKSIICDTPCGNIVKGLISSGGQVAVSTRGGGDITERADGVCIVNPDFILSTAADIVLDPSAPSAFVNGIMEGVSWIKLEGNQKGYKKVIDEIVRGTKYNRAARGEKYAKVLESYIKSLK